MWKVDGAYQSSRGLMIVLMTLPALEPNSVSVCQMGPQPLKTWVGVRKAHVMSASCMMGVHTFSQARTKALKSRRFQLE